MSKADQLGAGRFGASKPVSARRAAIGAATGVPTAGVPDPTELPVHRISLNPDNPRSTLGDLTDLAGSLRDHGQKQAITVMNRDAYLKANPHRADQLEANTTHVVVDGNSRLAAARDAGLTTVKVMVDDSQGNSEDELLESALVANIHRQDLDPLDEARALERLKAIHGTQEALAKRLHRSQGWVSQRLALLGLTPELQQRLAAGEESVDLLRAVGKKPPEQQEAALDKLKRRRTEKEKAKTAPPPSKPSPALATAVREGARYYGVMNEQAPLEPSSPTASAPQTPTSATQPEAASPSRETERTAAKTGHGTRQTPASPSKQALELPYDDGEAMARHLIRQMPADQVDTLLQSLLAHRGQGTAQAS